MADRATHVVLLHLGARGGGGGGGGWGVRRVRGWGDVVGCSV